MDNFTVVGNQSFDLAASGESYSAALEQAAAATEKHKPFEKLTVRKGVRAPLRYANRVRTGRNDPCPCGSGLKTKRCCRK